MILYVVRHASAESVSSDKDDKDRKLIEKGLKETKQVAKFLKKLRAKPDMILSSQLIRAIQTADIIAKKLNYKKKINLFAGLSPESKIDEILNFVKSKINSKTKSLLIVGHLPMLGDLISTLLGIKNYSFQIEKSGVYIFEINLDENKQIEVEFKGYITPSIARRFK